MLGGVFWSCKGGDCFRFGATTGHWCLRGEGEGHCCVFSVLFVLLRVGYYAVHILALEVHGALHCGTVEKGIERAMNPCRASYVGRRMLRDAVCGPTWSPAL